MRRGQGRVVRMARLNALGLSLALPVLVNAQPGAVVRDLDGLVVTVLGFDIVDGAVHTIRSIVNPDKIGHLGAVSPLTRRREGSGE